MYIIIIDEYILYGKCNRLCTHTRRMLLPGMTPECIITVLATSSTTVVTRELVGGGMMSTGTLCGERRAGNNAAEVEGG